MNLLKLRYPRIARNKQMRQVEQKLLTIPLKNPELNPQQYITIPETKPTQNTDTDTIINQYQLCQKNIYRTWKQTKSKKLLHALIWINTLKPLNQLISDYKNVIHLQGTTFCEWFQHFKPQIEKFLTIYEQYHTKTPQPDQFEQLLNQLETPE